MRIGEVVMEELSKKVAPCASDCPFLETCEKGLWCGEAIIAILDDHPAYGRKIRKEAK